MANTFNFYSDPACKNPVLYPGAGSVYIPTGSPYASINGWTQRDGRVYSAYINRSAGIILSAPAIYDARFQTSKIYDTNPEIVDGNTKNAFFVSANNDYQGNDASYYLQLLATMASATECDITVRFGAYTTQNQVYQTSGAPSGVVTAIIPTVSTSQFAGIRAATCNISGTDFIMIAAGVSDTGEFSPNGTAVLLVDREYFKTNIPKPYVGPVSKDSAAEFTPTTPKRDSIASRDLTGKKNPYGFNTGNGLKLLLLSAQEQADIVKRLYTGRSGDDLNAIGQTLSGVIGGNTHRPADELKTMIDAVLCCHIVPVISAGYAGGTNALYTVAGYQLYNPAKAVTQVSDQIITVTTQRTYIAPIVNNFLTYAPYCSVSLSVPFVGDIPLDTSALFASSIYFVFYLDLYTGTLSVDVHLVDDDGRDYIYTTRQTNCAVDIPIMGTGATGNPLQKIASAAGNVASAGVLGAPTAVYNVATATVDAQHATAIGRGASSNIAPYFSQRHCYLVIEYAESANADDFFTLNGGALEKSGTVGEFRGYTEFSAVDVSGIAGATDAEKRQIEQILKGGVYL